MTVVFQQAERIKKKARVLFEGPSGSGKSMSALLLAKGLARGGKIFAIDTERDSLSLYSNRVPFMSTQLVPKYTPERYVECIKAVPSECSVLIVDSITHEWAGEGGCLEIHGSMTGNSFVNWGKVGERHNAFIETMLALPYHLIVCCRSKTTFVQQEENGKKSIVKMGLQPQQRDGLDYEVDLVFTLEQDTHAARATKNRTDLWTDGYPIIITPDEGEQLLGWLESGAEDPEVTWAYSLLSEASKIKDMVALKEYFVTHKPEIERNSQRQLIYRKYIEWEAEAKK